MRLGYVLEHLLTGHRIEAAVSKGECCKVCDDIHSFEGDEIDVETCGTQTTGTRTCMEDACIPSKAANETRCSESCKKHGPYHAEEHGVQTWPALEEIFTAILPLRLLCLSLGTSLFYQKTGYTIAIGVPLPTLLLGTSPPCRTLQEGGMTPRTPEDVREIREERTRMQTHDKVQGEQHRRHSDDAAHSERVFTHPTQETPTENMDMPWVLHAISKLRKKEAVHPQHLQTTFDAMDKCVIGNRNNCTAIWMQCLCYLSKHAFWILHMFQNLTAVDAVEGVWRNILRKLFCITSQELDLFTETLACLLEEKCTQVKPHSFPGYNFFEDVARPHTHLKDAMGRFDTQETEECAHTLFFNPANEGMLRSMTTVGIELLCHVLVPFLKLHLTQGGCDGSTLCDAWTIHRAARTT